MIKRYDSFENGQFCIDIEHARRFDVASALMITQFMQGENRVFCRSFPTGPGVSRNLKDLLPIGNYDAMTILFSAYKPNQKIQGFKVGNIDDLIAKAKSDDAKFWVGDNAEQEGGAK